MPISRTYLCDDCAMQFTRLHWDRAEPVPACPYCESATARNIPGSFNIGTVKGKAVDIAYQIAEEDYGMTNMHDNLREGDVAAVAPSPVQTAEAEAIVREMKDAFGEGIVPEGDALQQQVKEFWKSGAPAASPESQQARANLEGLAVASAQRARADGVDPVQLLHEGAKKAEPDGMNLRVMSRSKLN